MRKKLIKKLDTVFSIFIRKRDKKCVICGTKERLTNGHLITRSKYSVRWSVVNCHCQCIGCNMLHEYQPERFTLWFIKKFGESVYTKLVLDSNKIRKFSNSDLETLIEQYDK